MLVPAAYPNSLKQLYKLWYEQKKQRYTKPLVVCSWLLFLFCRFCFGNPFRLELQNGFSVVCGLRLLFGTEIVLFWLLIVSLLCAYVLFLITIPFISISKNFIFDGFLLYSSNSRRVIKIINPLYIDFNATFQ